jgi:hypothetical protein
VQLSHRALSRQTAALAVLALSACSGLPGGGLGGADSPSLGNLVRVERRQRVPLKGEGRPYLAAGSGETLYLIWFEGKKEVHFETALPDFPLVDAGGREFPLLFAGSPTGDGALSTEGWKFASGGGKMSMGGRWAYGGTAELPEPRLVLVYAVPEDAPPLKLVDRDRQLELPVAQPTSEGRSESTETFPLTSM